MHFSTIATLAAATFAAAAPAPIAKRAGPDTYTSVSDYVILQYALTLEHLEDTFYRENLALYSEQDFTDAGFGSYTRGDIVDISNDEKTHVAFLTAALTSLNQTPVAACNYSFGVTDVKSFLATASILEGVGVSAYLGAAASIASKAYLTAAAAILTVESRHSSFIRGQLGEVPFPGPFDIPLDFDEVYSLASLFITSCPSSNDALPVKAFPALGAVEASAGYVTLTPVNASVLNGQDTIYAAWIGYPSNAYGVYDPVKKTVQIPEGFYGQNYVVLTTSMNVTDDSIIAGPAVFEIPGAPSS